jgi:hypothetical protein
VDLGLVLVQMVIAALKLVSIIQLLDVFDPNILQVGVAKAQITVLHLDVNSTSHLDAMITRSRLALAHLLLPDPSSVMSCMVELVSTIVQWLELLPSLMMMGHTFTPSTFWMY